LRIRISEREPIAQVNMSRLRVPLRAGEGLTSNVETAVYQLDADGYVMPPLEPGQRAAANGSGSEQLPLISGINRTEMQSGRRIEAVRVQAALQLIVFFEHSPMAGLVELRRIDVSSPEILTVTTGQGSEVTFGLTDLEQQLRRWREIYDSGQKIGKAISTLDLAVTNNIPARWLEASAVPASVPKLPKVLRTRKRHV